MKSEALVNDFSRLDNYIHKVEFPKFQNGMDWNSNDRKYYGLWYYNYKNYFIIQNSGGFEYTFGYDNELLAYVEDQITFYLVNRQTYKIIAYCDFARMDLFPNIIGIYNNILCLSIEAISNKKEIYGFDVTCENCNSFKKWQITSSYNWEVNLFTNDLLIFPIKDKLVGLSIKTGIFVWEVDKIIRIAHLVDFYSKVIVISDYCIYCINPNTGEQIWDKIELEEYCEKYLINELNHLCLQCVKNILYMIDLENGKIIYSLKDDEEGYPH